MGLWISRMLNLFGDQEARILVLGLDNAGKTTILCALTTRNAAADGSSGQQQESRFCSPDVNGPPTTKTPHRPPASRRGRLDHPQ